MSVAARVHGAARASLAALSIALAVTSAGLAAELPAESLYQLEAHLTTAQGLHAGLDLDRGHPTLIAMFYGSCPAACPMLIDAMQAYEGELDAASRARLRVLLVSFDAARDSPEQLERIARQHRADAARWTFASADERDTRRIAALLGVSYRRLPDGEYEHSLLITLLDGDGRIRGSTTRLVGDTEFEGKLRAATRTRAH
jgi:protein SCO1